ncbi:MAG: phage major capsid protein [Opitutaceae bacterium]|nr:phage major capsid protein [Opitutaceae bacterium]
MKIKELFTQKGAIVTKMRALLDTASAAKRDLTADESVAYSAMEKDLDAVTVTIDREMTVTAAEASVSGFRDGSYRPGVATAGADAPKTGRASAAYADAFINGLCRRGRNGLTTDHTNALQEGTNSEGGYLVPQEFETAIFGILNVIDPIRAAATVIQTASERNIPIEADSGSFAYVGEEGDYGDGDDPPSAARS